MASTQLAAFHQPVVSHKPLASYHCWRVERAVTVLALKSSPGTTAAQLKTDAKKRTMNENFLTKLPSLVCLGKCFEASSVSSWPPLLRQRGHEALTGLVRPTLTDLYHVPRG